VIFSGVAYMMESSGNARFLRQRSLNFPIKPLPERDESNRSINGQKAPHLSVCVVFFFLLCRFALSDRPDQTNRAVGFFRRIDTVEPLSERTCGFVEEIRAAFT
jgi:hypothetical protein